MAWSGLIAAIEPTAKYQTSSAAGVAAMMAELAVAGPGPTGMGQMKKRLVVAIKRQVEAEPAPRQMDPNCCRQLSVLTPEAQESIELAMQASSH